jgi:hypothetical protein
MPLPSSRRSVVTRTAATTRRPADARGFALLITITLLAFLVLLLVSLASLTRVETQVASNTQQLATARQNALLALNVALGQLQQAAGPDQRVTATADLLPATHPSKKYWTGVWDTSNPANNPSGLTPGTLPAPTWLVSGTTPTNTGAASTLAAGIDSDGTHVRLVGRATTETAATGNEIIVPLQDINAPAGAVPGLDSTATPVVARIGYWVGDEGVKARIDLDDPKTDRPATSTGNPSLPDKNPSDTEKRQSLMVAGRTGGELLATAASPAAAPLPAAAYLGDSTGAYEYAANTPSSANFRRDLAKLTTLQQASLLGTDFTPDFLKRRFHDITVHSQGVLADVANGGLKKDLTAGLLGSTVPPGLADTDTLFRVPALNTLTLSSGGTTPFTLPITASGNLPAQFPTWGALRSYVQLQNSLSVASPSIAPRGTTNSQMGIHPVIARYQVWFHVVRVDAPGSPANGSVRLLYFPAVVLWNPYDVDLAPTTYAMKIYWSATGATPYSSTDPLAVRWPKVLAEQGPVGISNPATGVAAIGSGTFHGTVGSFNTTSSKGFVINCTIPIPAGGTVVFTPSSNVDFFSATPANLELTPGWNTYFWWEQVIPRPTPGQEYKKLIILPRNHGEVDMQLSLDGAFTPATTSNPGEPAGDQLQRLFRANLWVGDTPTVAPSTGVTFPAPAANPARPAFDVSKDPVTKLPPTMPLGLFTGLFTGNPVAGHVFKLKMTNQVTGGDNGFGMKWISQYDPTAPALSRTAGDNVSTGPGTSGGYNRIPNQSAGAFATASGSFTINDPPDMGWSTDFAPHNAASARLVVRHLPRSETGVLSLGALQHASVHPFTGVGTIYDYNNTPPYGYVASAMPTYAIGNSFSDPRVRQTDPDGFPNDWGAWTLTTSGTQKRRFHFDLSLVLNRVLWDRFFFSSVPTTGVPAFPLANHRHTIYDAKNLGVATLAGNLKGYDTAAASLTVQGAFNINSTSREAWRALLASTRKAPSVLKNGSNDPVVKDQLTPFPRSPYPQANQLDSTAIKADGASSPPGFYEGYRSLTDEQLDVLAEKIVAQVKARSADSAYGPFRSLADFVNRRPTATATAIQAQGALQAAIDATTINKAADVVVSETGPAPNLADKNLNMGDRYYFSQMTGKAAEAAPGYLTQADLLQVLGPVISARSDTFLIRAYGETVNPLDPNDVKSRAWCEAVVQRVPDYVNDTADLAQVFPPTNLDNQTFGRRFKIVSMRWLSPADL